MTTNNTPAIVTIELTSRYGIGPAIRLRATFDGNCYRISARQAKRIPSDAGYMYEFDGLPVVAE